MLSFINIEVNNSEKFAFNVFSCLTSKSCVKRTCWDTRATDSIIKSGQKDTEASISDGVSSLKPPRITSVQYCGGLHQYMWGIASVLRRLFSTAGDSISTAGDGISTAGGWHQYCEGIASVHVGDSISTAEVVQYCEGIASVLRRNNLKL